VDDTVSGASSNQNQWKILSKKSESAWKELQESGSDFIDFSSTSDRFQAIIPADLATLYLITQGWKPAKLPTKTQKCSSAIFSISRFDQDVIWQQCGSSEEWIHAICEGVPLSEAANWTSQESIKCNRCSGISKEDLVCVIDGRVEKHLKKNAF